MRMGARRFRQAEESGSIEKQERTRRMTCYDGLARTRGSAEAEAPPTPLGDRLGPCFGKMKSTTHADAVAVQFI